MKRVKTRLERRRRRKAVGAGDRNIDMVWGGVGGGFRCVG